MITLQSRYGARDSRYLLGLPTYASRRTLRLLGRLLLHFAFKKYNCSVAEKKMKGPASYFPSIEKKYGKPIEHWMKELKKVSKLAHMEQVAHLKEKFEMGHGHANAIVAVFRKKNGL